MTSAIVRLNRDWLRHVLDCHRCEQWWLTDGRGLRCVAGYAISEVYEQQLEADMPSGARVPVEKPFCRTHGELTFDQLRSPRHLAEIVCSACGELVEWWKVPA